MSWGQVAGQAGFAHADNLSHRFIELRPDMNAHRRHNVKHSETYTFCLRFTRHDSSTASGTASTMLEYINATTFSCFPQVTLDFYWMRLPLWTPYASMKRDVRGDMRACPRKVIFCNRWQGRTRIISPPVFCHVHILSRTHACLHACMYACMHLFVLTRIYICTYVCVYLYFKKGCIHIDTYYTYIYLYIHIHGHAHIYIYICMYTYIHTNTHTHIYIY